MNRRTLLVSLATLPLFARTSRAQTKVLRIIVPFTPAGTTDILARALQKPLADALGVAVVVENIAGAGGSIGAERVAKAAPDGMTLLMGHIGTLAVNPSLYPNLPYDPIKSFAPVAWVANVPNILVVHPNVPVYTLPELVAYTKKNPEALNYGSGGNGSAAHLASEYLKLKTQAPMTHVPYKGTVPAVTDLLGGAIQLMFTGTPAVLAHIQAKKLRALAVSSRMRLAQLPELPTVAEQGYAGFEADQWYGVVAPAGTPADMVTRLNAAINNALKNSEMGARLESEGALPAPQSAAAFGEHIKHEIARWKPVIAAGKIMV